MEDDEAAFIWAWAGQIGEGRWRGSVFLAKQQLFSLGGVSATDVPANWGLNHASLGGLATSGTPTEGGIRLLDAVPSPEVLPLAARTHAWPGHLKTGCGCRDWKTRSSLVLF